MFVQGMQDMRDCYDSLLSAAAATANSAYGIYFCFLFLKKYYIKRVYFLNLFVCLLHLCCVSSKQINSMGENDSYMLLVGSFINYP